MGPVQSWQTELEGNNFTWQLCSARSVLCGGQWRQSSEGSGVPLWRQPRGAALQAGCALSALCTATDVTSGGVTPLLCRITGRWLAGLLAGCHQSAPCLMYQQPPLLTPTQLLLLFNTWRISSSAVWKIEYRRNNNFHLWRNTFGWD